MCDACLTSPNLKTASNNWCRVVAGASECAHRKGPVSKNSRGWLIFMVFASNLFSISYAQQTSPTAGATSRNLQLNVIVTPKSGVPVMGLQKEDFSLTDNKSP